MRKVLIEVRFKDSNQVKSFESEGDSYCDLLKECFDKIDKYNFFNDEYEILCILHCKY